jgi:aspartate aminotransferase
LSDVEAVKAFKKEFVEGARVRLKALFDGVRDMRQKGLPVDAIEPTGAIYLTTRFDVVGKKTSDGTTLATNEDVRRYVLNRAGVGVVPFQSFDYRIDDGWFRVSVGAVGLAGIAKALPRLRDALADLR